MNSYDKVLCIDDSWDLGRFDAFYFPNGLPVKGRVYSVAGTCRFDNADGLLIVGLPAIVSDGTDHGFLARRFMRLEEIKALVAAPSIPLAQEL